MSFFCNDGARDWICWWDWRRKSVKVRKWADQKHRMDRGRLGPKVSVTEQFQVIRMSREAMGGVGWIGGKTALGQEGEVKFEWAWGVGYFMEPLPICSIFLLWGVRPCWVNKYRSSKITEWGCWATGEDNAHQVLEGSMTTSQWLRSPMTMAGRGLEGQCGWMTRVSKEWWFLHGVDEWWFGGRSAKRSPLASEFSREWVSYGTHPPPRMVCWATRSLENKSQIF